jgi:glycine/D-amino acid oxidase-like deaminating enzyme
MCVGILASLISATCGMAASKAPIVIAGAGLHGSALAYYLTKRGEKPILLEQHAVAAAASGKGGGSAPATPLPFPAETT